MKAPGRRPPSCEAIDRRAIARYDGSMFKRALHRDPVLARLFDEWNYMRPHPALRAARRLFADMNEMQTFFQLAFPGSFPVQNDGLVMTSEGKLIASCPDILKSLESIGAKKADLQAAAFLVSVYNQEFAYRVALFHGAEAERARLFCDLLPEVRTDDLRALFDCESWQSEKFVRWVRGALALGVPAEYMHGITHVAYEMPHRSWPTWRIKALQEEGVPSEFIERFWGRGADFVDSFVRLLRSGVPYEYALAASEGVEV